MSEEARIAREALCRKMVRNGAHVVRDGVDHSNNASQCRVDDGNGGTKCVGYYCVLSDYDAVTDTFGGGYQKRIPASQVDGIGLIESMAELATTLAKSKSQFSQTPPAVDKPPLASRSTPE